MSEENFEIDGDYETDFDLEDETTTPDEPSKIKASPKSQKGTAGRRRLEDLLEAKRLQSDLVDYDELTRGNRSFYDDDIFSELSE